MELFEELNKSIEKKNNGAIDALMFIAKIETNRNKNFNYQDFKNNIGIHYKTYTKEHFEIYKEESLFKFFQLEEGNLEDGELFTDKIEKQIVRINLSVGNDKYKSAYIKMLKKYAENLGIPSANAAKFNNSQKVKNALIFATSILFLIVLVGTVWIRNNYEVNPNPKEALIYITVFTLFPGFSLLLITNFAALTATYKRFVLPILLILLVGFLSISLFFIPALTDPTNYTYKDTVVVKSIRNLKDNSNIKVLIIKEISGKEITLYAHKSLGFQVGKTYTVKGYKQINVITMADELAADIIKKALD